MFILLLFKAQLVKFCFCYKKIQPKKILLLIFDRYPIVWLRLFGLVFLIKIPIGMFILMVHLFDTH